MESTDLPETWIVRLELRRIQTFLFAVPRLRAMLGANALLGHAIRCALPKLAEAPDRTPLDLPWRAADLHRDDHDPIAEGAGDWTSGDDPVESLKHGVLSRDGGHLRIAFRDNKQAAAFIARARDYLGSTLPDLLYSLDAAQIQAGAEDDPTAPSDQMAEPVDLPHFQVCTRSGDGPATAQAHEASISAATRAKETAGSRFQDEIAGSGDYISLLRKHVPQGGLRAPSDLDELSDAGGYLAVIHADGNRVGQRIKAYQNSLGKLDWLAEQCAVERFFHSMRSAVRAALIQALHKVFTEDEMKRHQHRPYQLLMLGGDDLLLVCHPRYALPVVRHYAEQLAKRNLVDDKPLSIGAGVIIAKHTLPFHRLHQLAESLAGSAKRAYLQNASGKRGAPVQERSVVDWSVLTASWGEDPLEQRGVQATLDYGEGNNRVVLGLSAKPYFVLAADAETSDASMPSLQRLLETAERLEQVPELPRSPLKDMLRHLGSGYEGATLAYKELLQQLPKAAREHLVALTHTDSPWIKTNGDKDPIRAFTQLQDLIECLELRYLGRRKQEPRHD